ncbi:unnamed protein product [Linum trigynum]|uniref:Uncharacterized protein n=1 Tax=Linum trigynum TaxID=586398 RepID=A0AAV2G0B1_9ROSI
MSPHPTAAVNPSLKTLISSSNYYEGLETARNGSNSTSNARKNPPPTFQMTTRKKYHPPSSSLPDFLDHQPLNHHQSQVQSSGNPTMPSETACPILK